MADSKITALTALTAADPINDMFPVVDVSDTSMAASGTTKRISVNNILSSSPTASGALTVTGLVTAGSATITGALGAAGLNVTGATIPANGVYLGSANNLSFSYASTLGMTLNSTGLNIANGNVILGTSGKGIDFSATSDSSGTMTSELLNDYEEGTWVPNIGGTATYTIQSGTYTKVGRIVTASFDIAVLVIGTGTQDSINNLPFSASSSVGNAVAFSYLGGLAASSASVYGYANSTYVVLNRIAGGGGTGFSASTVVTSGTRIAGTIVYMV